MHFKISYVDNNEEIVAYKAEVPDMKKMTNSTLVATTNVQSPATAQTTAANQTTTSTTTTTTSTTHTTEISNGSATNARHHSNKDGIVIKLDSCRSLSGDIKVEFYTKHMMSRRKTLFSFWFNTYFISEKQHDGEYAH